MCGAVLSVKQQPGLEKMSVMCPVCKQQSKFTDFTPCNPVMAGEHTQLITGGAGLLESKPVALRVVSSGRIIPLTEDEYIVGRKSHSAAVKIQLECPGLTTSREHLRLVKKLDSQGVEHWLVSLAKERVNRTSIGMVALEPGDVVELKPGTMIHLPDIDLEFIELKQ